MINGHIKFKQRRLCGLLRVTYQLFHLVMAPTHVPRSAAARAAAAKTAVIAGAATLRAASARYCIPRSTLHDKVMRQRLKVQSKRAGRPKALSNEEEGVLVELILRYADRGIPLKLKHVAEATTIMVDSMDIERREGLPFTDGRPGRKFLRAFLRRHKNQLRFSLPVSQERVRWNATNADALVHHFANLLKLLTKFNLDGARIWNLDETGGTPGKDVVGNKKAKRVTRKQGDRDLKRPEMHRANRVTLMPVVSADGDTGPPLFVFKGVQLPYRKVLSDGNEVTQTYHSVLPRGSVVAMRERGGGVDGANFFEWAHKFIESVKDLTAGERKVLLIYDGYRSHMSFRVLKLLRQNNIIAYALPSHTSGKTQPCDVKLFGAYKKELDELMDVATDVGDDIEIDNWAYGAMMCEAYKQAFTRSNIQAAFRRSGIWPHDPSRLLGCARPNAEGNLITSDQLENMMNMKREEVRNRLFDPAVTVMQSGFVDTRRGAVLTSDDALQATEEAARKRREREDNKTKAEREKQRLNAEKAKKEHERVARKALLEAQARMHMENARWIERARLAGRKDVTAFKNSVRPLIERRRIARERTVALVLQSLSTHYV